MSYWRRFTQAPTEMVDRPIDFSDVLGNDTIASETHDSDGGIGIFSSSHDSTTVTLRIYGGTDASFYDAYAEVTTAAGQKFRKTIQIRVRGAGVVYADIDGGAPINDDTYGGAPVDGGPP
jgi:hypothetical protein